MGIFDMFGDPKQRAAKKSAALRNQAMKNARKAREAIGEEALQKVAAIMADKNKQAAARAKAEIEAMDKARIADHLKSLLDDK